MILPSEDEKKEAMPQVLEPQATTKGPSSTVPPTHQASTPTKGEELKVSAKELDKYFLFSSIEQANSLVN